MPNIALSETRVKALRPRQSAYDVRDVKLKGFGVRVLPSGATRFSIHVQHRGKRIWKIVGNASAMNLNEARTRATAMLVAVRDGADAPALPEETLFESVAEATFRRYARVWKGSVAKIVRNGELSAFAGARGWRMNDFKGRHFGGEIVLWAVRWYCRYAVSYRDLQAMTTERGVAVDHSTIYRWVQRFAPEMEKRLRWQWRRPQSRSWRIDETYVKVRGKWAYLYRALDKFGNTIDFYLSATRNTKAAKRFLGKALRGWKDWELPEVLNTDKAPTYASAIAELKAEGKCPTETRHRQVKYLNNVIEADHGKLKQLIRPVRGFKTLKTAYATIKGFEVMRALRKGQASIFAIQGGIVGEARIVERAFGVGPCALTEAMALLQDHLASADT